MNGFPPTEYSDLTRIRVHCAGQPPSEQKDMIANLESRIAL